MYTFLETDLTIDVFNYAKKRHGAKKQKRKGTGQPYIVHPVEVATIVSTVTSSEILVSASLLHDVVEDTFHERAFGLAAIEKRYGREIASLVEMVTDISVPSDGGRAIRKAIDRNHLAQANPDGKTIKLGDCISNSANILELKWDGFAYVYLPEMLQLVDVLQGGDTTLHARFVSQLNRARLQLTAKSS
ncbi:MAG: HD domain-containing protein [Methylophilus sp.]|uniref:HD domain-containing protein n=1 Tax=Methylophilus sp. TaxID=29541 RepID=UPI003FA05D6A